MCRRLKPAVNKNGDRYPGLRFAASWAIMTPPSGLDLSRFKSDAYHADNRGRSLAINRLIATYPAGAQKAARIAQRDHLLMLNFLSATSLPLRFNRTVHSPGARCAGPPAIFISKQ
jgi:hypothetical protein